MIKGVIALLLIFLMMGTGMAYIEMNTWIQGDGLTVTAAYSLQDNGDRIMISFYVYDHGGYFEDKEMFIELMPGMGLNKTLMKMAAIQNS